MSDSIALGLGLFIRALECLETAAPTLVAGVVLAALCRVLVRDEFLRSWLGGAGWGPRARALMAAPLFPVCGLGVLPLVREFQRAGLATGTLVTFALAASLLNPFVLIYGLTSLPVLHFLAMVLSAALVALLAGARAFRGAGATCQGDTVSSPTLSLPTNRLLGLGVVAARMTAECLVRDALPALLVTALASCFVPANFLPQHLLPGRWETMPLMLLVALPQYVAPPTAMMQVVVLVRAGLSFGAGIVLYLLGVGVNAAMAAWWSRLMGIRQTLLLVVALALVSLGLGWASDLAIPRIAPSDRDMDALELLTRPALEGTGPGPLFSQAGRVLSTSFNPAVAILAGLLLIGSLLQRLGIDEHVTTHSAPPCPRSPTLSKRQIVAAGILVVAILGLGLLYTYYPPIDQLFAEMTLTRADAILELRAGHTRAAIRPLQAWDDLAGKLLMSAHLRGSFPEPSTVEATTALRRTLQEARAKASPEANAQGAVQELEHAYHRCRESYGF